MTNGGLPGDLRDWIASTAGGAVVSSHRHLAGASRQAWSVDVECAGVTRPLFVLRDNLSSSGGSMRDAAVAKALKASGVPVPDIVGTNDELAAVLMSRVEGRSDFPSVDDDAEREPTARHLMELAAQLHALDPARLSIAHLGAPADPSQHAGNQLAHVEGIAKLVGDRIAPLFTFALAWLRRNVPTDVSRTSLVHSDMGPGNFLYKGGRVTALLDWEVAHWGDAMEDLAAISVRDMATPVGYLPTRYAEYEAADGGPVDLARVRWYRVMVLTRNSMLIGLGLSRNDAAVDRAQLTMFRSLLMRADALALCDAIGVERPSEAPLAEGHVNDDVRLTAHAGRDLRDTVQPQLSDSYASGRAAGAASVLGYLEQRLRCGDDYLRRELEDLASMIGRHPTDEIDGFTELRAICDDASRERELAAFFGRHLLRRGMLVAPLLGPLAERYPQPLE